MNNMICSFLPYLFKILQMYSHTKQHVSFPHHVPLNEQNKTCLLDPILFSAEKGDFLTLDLGGTNFRVQHVHANEKKLEIKSEKKLSIPKEIMQQPGEKVFLYILVIAYH